MKANLLIMLIILFASSCGKEQYSKPVSISYESSFSTEPRPIAIAVKQNPGYVYIANCNPGINNYSSKIQKFNLNGELLKTAVDFTTFIQGKYSRYNPIDICIDNTGNLYALVKPSQLNEEPWTTYKRFCVLQFDIDDNLKKEYDFSEFDHHWIPSAIAYSNNKLYVTNGLIIKKISLINDQVTDISIQTNTENTDSLIFLHVSDMIIKSEGIIYLTGQAAQAVFNDDVSGCHVTRLEPQTNKLNTFYSRGRTGIMAAMLNNPGLAISDIGNLYLATFYGKSLEVYDRSDEFILQVDIRTVVGDDTSPIDLALNNNHIYIADHQNNNVHIFKEHY